MAKTWIRRRDFEDGTVPQVCALTGQPAEHLVTMRITSTPTWPWILLPISLLSFALANWYAAEKIDGALPLTEAVLEWHRRLKLAVRGVGIGAVVLLLLAGVASSPALAVAAGVAALVWLVLTVVRQVRSVGGRLDTARDWLLLRGVHARFADALDAQYEQAGVKPGSGR